MTIAGGAAWPHWLRSTVAEGQRWLDDAFSCAGSVSNSTRALGLTGRGLLEFLGGRQERADADLEEALAIFRADGNAAGETLAHSFYRTEEHTSELQALMRTSNAGFCLEQTPVHTPRHKYQQPL